MRTRHDVEVALTEAFGDILSGMSDTDWSALTDFAYHLLYMDKPVNTPESLVAEVINDNLLFAEALAGNRITAVRLLRERTGAGLADATNAIDAAVRVFESHKQEMTNPPPF